MVIIVKASIDFNTLSRNQIFPINCRCNASGHFEKLQCSIHYGVCWCVDPETGKKIDGTQKHGIPDCTGKVCGFQIYI